MVFANVSLFFVRFFIKEKKGREVKIVFLIVIRLKVFTAEKGALFVIFLQLLKKKKNWEVRICNFFTSPTAIKLRGRIVFSSKFLFQQRDNSQQAVNFQFAVGLSM